MSNNLLRSGIGAGGVSVLRAAMIADSEGWGVADGIGHDSG
jgi:hypothetical protein